MPEAKIELLTNVKKIKSGYKEKRREQEALTTE
jgi:hypothetical protein